MIINKGRNMKNNPKFNKTSSEIIINVLGAFAMSRKNNFTVQKSEKKVVWRGVQVSLTT